MATYIARAPSNDIEALRTDGDELSPAILRRLTQGWTLYSVTPAGGGSFTLTPQRVVQGTAVTEPRLISAQLEDDI